MIHNDAFHAGEIAVQTRAGERAIAAGRESVIRHRLNDAAKAFVEGQDTVAAAAAAPDGTLWASLWCGAKGFLRGDADGDSVRVFRELDGHAGDPVRPIVRPNEPLALLVIDLATRRRLRINGVVRRVDHAGLELTIRETLGNCPKYIQQRVRTDGVTDKSSNDITLVQRGSTLDADRRSSITRVDTLFVATVHGERGLDVSHRGGRPGFVRVVDDRRVRIPDYPGNSLFQSLGNLELDSRCSIAFIDFERHRVISTSGHAVIEFGAEDPMHSSDGTGRYWSFTIDHWIEFPLPPAMRWTLVERSPFNPR